MEYTITIQLEADPDTMPDVIYMLDTILPYMTDNVLVTSRPDQYVMDRVEYDEAYARHEKLLLQYEQGIITRKEYINRHVEDFG